MIITFNTILTASIKAFKQGGRALMYCTLMSVLAVTSTVSAFDERFYSSNGILFYSPDAVGASTETSCIQGGGSLEGFLKALAKQESGGNPTATNPYTSAAGKYQYLTSTWRARASLYPGVSKYATADKAPESVQDAVAYIEYAQKWEEFNGDIFSLALSHFLPAALDDESLLDKHPGGSPDNPTPREYGEAVVDKVNNSFGSEIPLSYADAPGFDEALTKAVKSTTNFSGKISSNPLDCASVGGSGLTESQAKKFVMNYGKNENGESEKAMGASYWDACKGGGANCVSFSRFFVNKFTGTQAPTPMGNGEAVVDNMRAAGVPTGSTPKLYAVFSWDGGTYGHTGVVLGMNGDQVIVGHASCNDSVPGTGDGTTLTAGAAIIRVGKADDPSVWLGKVPSEFAYPNPVKTADIEKYISN